jgi:hypothetical protein
MGLVHTAKKLFTEINNRHLRKSLQTKLSHISLVDSSDADDIVNVTNKALKPIIAPTSNSILPETISIEKNDNTSNPTTLSFFNPIPAPPPIDYENNRGFSMSE